MHPEYSPQEDDEDLQHDALPNEAKDHMWAAFAHKAGVGRHPGKYKGPAIPQTLADQENQRESAQDESISNLASGQNPVIPSPAKKIPSMTPPTPKPVKFGSALVPQPPPDAGNLSN